MNPGALRVAIVGPTHPAKGGVAAHTTALAHELTDAGHDVVLVSWAQMYPSFLYPGEPSVPGGVAGTPDVEPYARTVPVLRWSRPEGWVRTGRRLRDVDLIVIVHVVPQVAPAHLAILRAAGVGSPGAPRSVVIAHNVLPHEARPGDRPLVRLLLGAVDAVVVHSEAQGALARDLGAARVAVAELPAHLPGGDPVPRPPHDGPTRLLALGIVRDYKGIDLLLGALARVPGPTLTIAGELWGDAGRRVRELAADPRLAGRVRFEEGYAPADRLPTLLAEHDVLALAYRHATASQNVMLAHEHGLAVLASDVGTFGRQVRDGVDGLLVPAEDEPALVEALTRLADPTYAAHLRAGIRPPDLHGPWATYIGTLEALASTTVAADAAPADPLAGPDGDPGGPGPGRLGGARAVAVGSGAASLRRAADAVRRVTGAARSTVGLGHHVGTDLHRADLPEWVRPVDLLVTEADATDARALARDLGLPREGDAIAAWAALGALAAILRLVDHGNRDAVVVDASGTDSPFTRWAEAVGFATIETGAGTALWMSGLGDAVPAGCDALVALHPNDVAADDVDDVLAAAEWSLRPGGLLVLTVAVGPATVAGAVAAADVRAILARADDRSLVLVGDLEGDLTERMRGARLRARDRAPEHADTAYGIVRLTFRRR